MNQRLFKTGKVGCFIDSYAPGVEKRRGDEVSVLSVKFRVQPFDASLASSLDAGVGGDSNIRPTVFSLNTTEPKPNFTRHDFKLGTLPRQNIEFFAAPDTETSRVLLPQAKIAGCYVRTQKDMNALAFVFKATFGPVSRDQLELIHSLHRLQAFVSFTESEPLLEEEDDDEPELAATGTEGQAPMWEDDVPVTHITDVEVFTTDKSGRRISEAPKVERAHRKLHSHQGKRKGAKRAR